MKAVLFLTLWALCFAGAEAQVPVNVGVQILKAEDARRYDVTLESLMRSPNQAVRERAILAAGRIGREEALPLLTELLNSDKSDGVRSMAAFAIGEIESIQGADAVLAGIKAETSGRWNMPTLARLIEAAGKIATANPKEEKSKQLGKAILDVVNGQAVSPSPTDTLTVKLGLTALLRARPEGADEVVAKFLGETDPRLRADAANTLTRIRAKNASKKLRDLVLFDKDNTVRINAIRALAAAEDKDSTNLFIAAATADKDPAIRIAAIRAVAAIKDEKAAEPLIVHGEKLLGEYKADAFRRPATQNELLELFTTLGRLIPNSQNERAVDLIRQFGKRDKGHSPEAYIARVRIAPVRGDDTKPTLTDWHQYSTLAQVVGEFASIEPTNDEGKRLKSEAPGVMRPLAQAIVAVDPKDKLALASPDVLRAFARFKTDDLNQTLRDSLKSRDVFLRAAAAELMADQPASKENVNALKSAFAMAFITDKLDNDAQLSILDATYKLDKNQSVGILLNALTSYDYLVRRKAFELLADKDLQKDFPGIELSLADARKRNKDQVLAYSRIAQTRLGQMLNSDADYRRALLRKNGSVKAVVATEKGTFTIDFYPEDAPLTVDNFIKLARTGYFNGLEVHRVVPNFVMQDGDPRGDGNGGPGWSIRCEVNMREYDRGAVGMALSGKDTGGSQWFVTHLPQPHLDGGYTVFGQVNEKEMKVVDTIVRGDKILTIKIIETAKRK